MYLFHILYLQIIAMELGQWVFNIGLWLIFNWLGLYIPRWSINISSNSNSNSNSKIIIYIFAYNNQLILGRHINDIIRR